MIETRSAGVAFYARGEGWWGQCYTLLHPPYTAWHLAYVGGIALVLAYNLELGGGRMHTPTGFALAWGAYPVVVGYFAQTGRVSVSALVAAAAATALSAAQRSLSAPARVLRRRVLTADLHLTLDTGKTQLTTADLLRPLEHALRALTLAVCLLAVAAVVVHWNGALEAL